MSDPRSACPGVPDLCEHSKAVISRVLEGVPDTDRIDDARTELGACAPCVSAIDLQMQFKVAMSQHRTDGAPPALQMRISETLRRIDLGQIDVTDL